MPLEVKQLIIRSRVDGSAALPAAAVDPRRDDRLKAEIMAECKAWFEDRLQQLRER